MTSVLELGYADVILSLLLHVVPKGLCVVVLQALVNDFVDVLPFCIS